jgi:hypothetical protein
VDAAGAVDAQTAPTAPWKPQRTRFPTAPTAFFIFLVLTNRRGQFSSDGGQKILSLTRELPTGSSPSVGRVQPGTRSGTSWSVAERRRATRTRDHGLQAPHGRSAPGHSCRAEASSAPWASGDRPAHTWLLPPAASLRAQSARQLRIAVRARNDGHLLCSGSPSIHTWGIRTHSSRGGPA